jgi:hypothetical protein
LTKLNFEKALSQLQHVTGIVTKSDNVLKMFVKKLFLQQTPGRKAALPQVVRLHTPHHPCARLC